MCVRINWIYDMGVFGQSTYNTVYTVYNVHSVWPQYQINRGGKPALLVKYWPRFFDDRSNLASALCLITLKTGNFIINISTGMILHLVFRYCFSLDK